MGRILRFVVIGFVMDLAIYVALASAPVLSVRWHARKEELGLLALAWGLSYALSSMLGGRISDRMSRTALMRGGLLLVAASCLAFTQATATWHFYVGLPLMALGIGFFWPSVQAAIADESGPETLSRNIGLFNVSWCLGKSVGVLAGGHLVEWLGADGFYAAAGLALLVLVFLPHVPRGGGLGTSFLAEAPAAPARVREAFRWAALLANFAAYGVATTIVNHYAEWNHVLGRAGGDYGIVVGAVFLAQTLFFGLLIGWRGFWYRRWPLLLPQLAAAGGVLLLLTRLPPLVLAPLMLLIGGGLAVSYFASIRYSLHSDSQRGARAGLHEGIIGAGHFLVPLAAGYAASATGSARTPYLAAAAVALAAVAVQAALVRPSRLQSRAARESP